MKCIFPLLILFLGLLFFPSCDEEQVHGCFDSIATNYDEEAVIDNNSCCYTCYISSTGEDLGAFCEGSELQEILNGYAVDFVHMWSLNGELVPPGTIGAVPAYNADLTPIITPWTFQTYCD